jgi:outer membrane protein TolC
MKRSACLTILALLLIARSGIAENVTLDEVLRKTVDKNPEIQAAKLKLEEAYGHRLVFRSVALPDAIIGVVGGDQGGHRAGQKANQPFGFAYGGFTQPLFNAAIPASLRRGDIEVLIAQQQLNMAVVDHLHGARTAFYTAIYNRSLKQMGEEQRRRLQEISRSQESRYQAGLADRGVFIGAQLQSRELDPGIGVAERGYAGAELRIAELMGDDMGSTALIREPEGELTYKTLDLDPDRATAAALQGRADLKLARLLVRAANEDQRIIEAAYYPSIYAQVSGDYIPVSGVRRQSEGSPRRQDDVVSSEIRAGTAYTWRVVDNGLVRGAAIKQRSAREINELLLHQMEADIPRELARIRNNVEAIETKRAALIQATAAAEQNAESVRKNLEQGVMSQYEFHLAENGLTKIQTALLGLAYQQNLALAEWDRVTGRYFQFSDGASQNVQ